MTHEQSEIFHKVIWNYYNLIKYSDVTCTNVEMVDLLLIRELTWKIRVPE